MTPGAKAQGLIELLQIYGANKTVPADTVLSRYLKERRYIGSKDRQFLAHHFFQIMRMYHALKDKGISERILVARYFSWVGKMPVEEVAFWFDGSNYHPHVLTKDEIRLVEKNTFNYNNRIPAWVRPLLPIQDEELDECLLKNAPVDLRVNLFKTTYEEVYAGLLSEGFYTPERMHYSKIGLRLKRRLVYGHPLLQDAQVEFQDEGSQIASLLVDANENTSVLDLCAGAGGKALCLANVMNNNGEIVLSDIHDFRLKRAKERLLKAGVNNAQIIYMKDLPKREYDRVLLDVPCSGSGTWRRKPDLLMKLTPDLLKDLLNEQKSILEKSITYVKVGGRLIYVTCSLFSCENEDQIKLFLEKHPNFKKIDLSTIKSPYLTTTFLGDELNLTPWTHGCDGFYVVVMEKMAPDA